MSQPPADAQVTEAWKAHRPHLVDLAFRMLGDIGEAEDTVQEAFSRLMRARIDEIEDERGWLIVVTSRLCLDQIRSARSRHQSGQEVGDREVGLPGTRPGSSDPVDRVTLDDNVRLALLVVLERLSPAERVVFVLHDIFQMPFDDVADTVGRSAPSCRQLARRARHKIEENGRGRTDVESSQHRLVTEQFISACANGDLEGLLAVLDPDVSGDADGGRVTVGAEAVARIVLVFFGHRGTLVSQSVGGRAALLGFVDRRLVAVLLLTVTGDRITKIHAMIDDTKLSVLRAQLAAHG
jgi:RNA polymerase sigma-70 factor, ECF subfamily